MSLAAFQQALTVMTLDVARAAAVRHEGESALAPWPLTALEKRRLVAMARQPGMELSCTLARGNRFAAVHDAFAMTCVLLGRELRPVLDRLWSEQQPHNVQLSGDAELFAAVVLQHAGSLRDEQQRRCLRDVLAYEQQAYELALSVRHSPDPERVSSPPCWLNFDHDPQLLFDALRAFEPPPAGLPLAPHRVRLMLVDGALETAIFEVQSTPG